MIAHIKTTKSATNTEAQNAMPTPKEETIRKRKHLVDNFIAGKKLKLAAESIAAEAVEDFSVPASASTGSKNPSIKEVMDCKKLLLVYGTGCSSLPQVVDFGIEHYDMTYAEMHSKPGSENIPTIQKRNVFGDFAIIRGERNQQIH